MAGIVPNGGYVSVTHPLYVRIIIDIRLKIKNHSDVIEWNKKELFLFESILDNVPPPKTGGG